MLPVAPTASPISMRYLAYNEHLNRMAIVIAAMISPMLDTATIHEYHVSLRPRPG